MKKILFLFALTLLFNSGLISNLTNDVYAAGTNPVISVGQNIVPVAGVVTVPVNLTNLSNAGAISLKIQYNSSVLTFNSAVNKPSSGNFVVNSSNGVVTIGWFDTKQYGSNDGKFVDLQFTYKSGNTNLTFLTSQCEIADAMGNTISSVEYINGSVVESGTSIPVIRLGQNVLPVNGSVTIPVNIENFNNVGAVSLKIQYDSNVLTYVDAANKPSHGNFTSSGSGNVVTIGWFDTTPITTNSGKFVDLTFTYKSGACDLSFLTSQCEIADINGTSLTPVTYVNGSVASGMSSNNPIITIPGNITPVGTTVTVPINMKNMNDIGAVSLKIQYDTNVLSYTGFENKPSNGNFTSNANSGVVTIGWFDTNPLGISDGKFVDLKFTYKGGSTNLAFITGCEIANTVGATVSQVSYVNGSVTESIINTDPAVKLGENIAPSGNSVIIPVNVQNLVDVGAVSLKIQFNSSVITYAGYANQPAKGNFVANASGNSVTIGWFDTAPLGMDSAKFVDLKFNYIGGTCSLDFQTAQCEIADTKGNAITTVKYANGSIVANQAPYFTVEMPDLVQISENQSYTFQYKAADPNTNQVLVYSLAKKPAGAKIDSLSGLFSWTPSYNQSGSFEIECIVSDGGLKDTSKVSVINVTNVNQPPVFTSELPDTTIKQGQTIVFQFKASDPDGVKLAKVKTVVIKFHGISLPTGSTLDSLTGIFTWKPTYKQSGDFNVIVSVTDGITASSDTAKITVQKANAAPYFTKILDSDTLHANRTYTFQLKGEDPNGDAVTFSLGANPPSGATLNGAEFKWTIGLNQVGNQSIAFKISDGLLTTDTTVNVLITGAVGVQNEVSGPTKYAMKQNYPNPFNPSTVIRYEIPVTGFVSLKVYNIIGKEVATLVNGDRTAGYYEVEFTPDNLPSGLYLYKLKAGDYSEVRKMLLLK